MIEVASVRIKYLSAAMFLCRASAWLPSLSCEPAANYPALSLIGASGLLVSGAHFSISEASVKMVIIFISLCWVALSK